MTLWALIALNVALAMTLVTRFGKENTAVAQVGRAGDYLMVPGTVVGGTDAVVYILDMTSGMLGAVSFNSPQNTIDFLQPIDLNRLFDATQGVGPQNAPATPANRAPRR